jgi:hypothetical protein
MCVFCWDFVEGLCAEIDGFNVCVLLEFIERLYAVIHGFQCVCSAGILLKDYVLKLMVSMCVFCWNLVTVYMLGLLQHVVCVHAKIVIRCRNCVGCSELAFAAETKSPAAN